MRFEWPTPDSFCLFSFFSNNILNKNGRLQKDSNCSSSEKKASKLTTRPLPRPVWPDGFIIFQSLAVYNYENFLHSIKFAKVGTNVCLKSNQNNCKNFWKTVKMLPKWRNFAKSGHTAHGSCNLNVKRSKFFCINFLVWQFALDDKTSHQLLLWAVPFKSVYFLALAKHWHINACLNYSLTPVSANTNRHCTIYRIKLNTYLDLKREFLWFAALHGIASFLPTVRV